MSKHTSLAWVLFVYVASLPACASREEASEAESAIVRARAGLRALSIDESQTSVSGLSSGGFMAVQFHVAFSASMRGVAVFAGGPYDCAQGSLATALTTCMSSTSKLDVSASLARTRANAATGSIDPVEGLRDQNVYLFGGALDHTVEAAVMDGLAEYYRTLVDRGQIVYESRRPGVAHTMPTRAYGSACDRTASPYVGRCNFDGAGAALAAIYGPLSSPAESLSGRFVEIEQTPPVGTAAAHSLADVAYAYVPEACEQGARCRVHVAFHGCAQSVSKVGDAFYKHAGYNEWADTNSIVVLYPQTIAGSGNANGCWDWYGYDSGDYARRSGPQMATVKRMVDGLARGDGAAARDAGAPPVDGGGGRGAVASCLRSTNPEHVAQGRAHSSFGMVVANGTNAVMGVYSPLVSSTLLELSPGVYRPVARCP